LYVNQEQGNTTKITTEKIPENEALQKKLDNELVTVTDIENIQTPFTLFLCSDGFQDQFGGKDDRKFMTSKMKTLFTEISLLPADEQKQRLQNTFNIWKGNKKQTDDVTIIGLNL
jgi:hypothetical protein